MSSGSAWCPAGVSGVEVRPVSRQATAWTTGLGAALQDRGDVCRDRASGGGGVGAVLGLVHQCGVPMRGPVAAAGEFADVGAIVGCAACGCGSALYLPGARPYSRLNALA